MRRTVWWIGVNKGLIKTTLISWPVAVFRPSCTSGYSRDHCQICSHVPWGFGLDTSFKINRTEDVDKQISYTEPSKASEAPTTPRGSSCTLEPCFYHVPWNKDMDLGISSEIVLTSHPYLFCDVSD